jgi:hypothetical protein
MSDSLEVRNDTPSSAVAAQLGNPSNAVGPTIDTLSKVVALGIAFVYISGFLITSLNDFRYGFSEMNPFRPRILAAGGWFFLFLAIPLALVRALMKHQVWTQEMGKWHKTAVLIFLYYISCNVLFIFAPFIFTFDETTSNTSPHVAAWKIIAAIIVLLVLIVVLSIYYSKIPKSVVVTSVFLFAGFMLWQAEDALFIRHRFERNAPILWLLAVGFIVASEMRSRSWKMTIGDWPSSLIAMLAILAVFATAYYPHIEASWGGGTPIPVEVILSKDFPTVANQPISCLLIDETDSGYYVIGKGDKHATFIPKTAVSLMHFSDGDEPSVFTTKPK